MIIKNKRGQAALEFLTTYGWAFLVILVMIGALAYFGVLDPARFTPQRCQVGAPFTCDGENYVLRNLGGTDGEIVFRLRNTLNNAYNIAGVQLKDASGTFVDCASIRTSVNPVPVDGFSDVTCVMTGVVPVGEVGSKQRVIFQVIYYDDDVAFSKVVPGEIYANVVG